MRTTGEHNDERECSAYCSVGEPAILSAPGGAGKSYLALSVALSAVTGKPTTDEGDAPELEPAVACGPAPPSCARSRIGRCARGAGCAASCRVVTAGSAPTDSSPPHPLHVCYDPSPLFAGEGVSGRRLPRACPERAACATWSQSPVGALVAAACVLHWTAGAVHRDELHGRR